RAGRFGEVAEVLQVVSEWRRRLTEGALLEGALEVPAELFGDDMIAADDERAAGALRWREAVQATAAAAEMSPNLSRADAWTLAVDLFAEGGRFETKPAGALE